MSGKERRAHPRISVVAEVFVLGKMGTIKGTLHDVSLGGAAIVLPEQVDVVGAMVDLFLPSPDGVELTVRSRILRVEEVSKGLMHGVQFEVADPKLGKKLVALINLLLQSKDAKAREHPRVAKRLPIQVQKISELKTMLENISMGGLAMTVASPLRVGETVEVSLPDPAGGELLILTGRVIHQKTLPGKSVSTYHVGLEFQNLTPAARSCLEAFLKSMVKTNPEPV